MDNDVSIIDNQPGRMGMGKRKIVEEYDCEEDIEHIFENQDRMSKDIQDLKPFFVEYSKHMFRKKIAKEKKKSYNVCQNMNQVKKRNKEIDKEEIRQIMRENKKLKKHAGIQEIQINHLRNKYSVVIV